MSERATHSIVRVPVVLVDVLRSLYWDRKSLGCFFADELVPYTRLTVHTL